MTDRQGNGEITETWEGHVSYVDEQGVISSTIYEPELSDPRNNRSVEHEISPSDIPEHIRRKLGQDADFICKVKLTQDREWLSEISNIVPIAPTRIDKASLNEALEEFSFLKDPKSSE